jgi:hypothetical protein
MPLWGWMGVGLAVALVWAYWRNSQSQKATAASPGVTDTGTTDSSLIPQFVNQVYTNTTPPSAPVPGPPGPVGPQGPPGNSSAKAHQYPAPTGVTAKAISRTSVKVAWNYITSIAPRPSSYTLAVYNKAGKLVSQQTVNAPDTATGQGVATVSGLPNGQGPFHVNVWANGGALAPQHGTAQFTLL